MGAYVLVERVLVLERLPALFASQIFSLNLVQEPKKIREGKLNKVVDYKQKYTRTHSDLVLLEPIADYVATL
jgi:hypothetical protein